MKSLRYLLSIAAAILLSISISRAAENGGEMVLSADFRASELKAMPSGDSRPGVKVTRLDYPAHDAIEWQVRVEDDGRGEPRLYADLKSADFVARFPIDRSVTLHWSKGSHTDISDYQPREERLEPGKPFALESFGGRSSDGVMPYFNLAGEGGGLIVAIGWPGDWKAGFEAMGGGKIRVTVGLKRSRFRLKSNETLRLPSLLTMPYRGDWIDGQNRFRRLMLAEFTPKSHPPMELMPVAASVHGTIAFNDTTEAKLTSLASDIAALKLPIDTFWLDAGWNEGGFPLGQGTPNPDPTRFPRGLAPVGEAARKGGMRFLAWFEPERAMRGTWLDREHRDWLLTPTGTPEDLRYMEKDGFRLLDLGNPQARSWAIETISKQITDAGIAVYRQDFNEYPSFFWHTKEKDDEVGLREIRHINGLYDFLDELKNRHPGLILDNCASGGRRLDFEMMRRCVALWRSDSCWDDRTFPRNVQAMTLGLSLWLPLHGLGSLGTDAASLRSGMGSCSSYPIDYRNPKSVAALRAHLERYLPVRHLFSADFYPLTPWTEKPGEWLAFQYHDPEAGEGLVQCFLGADDTDRTLAFKLRGLDPAGSYLVTDWDNSSSPIRRTGKELIDPGLPIPEVGSRSAKVFHYKIDRR